MLTIIGGGLAGCEAAWQAAQRGVAVELYEMRPKVPTAVHRTGDLAELVCSNSLKSNDPGKASGLLKREMRRLGSLIIECGDASSVPAGSALAVDRAKFAALITERLQRHPLVTVRRDELPGIPDTPCIVSSGPLTSPQLAQSICETLGQEFFNFFDAVAPVVDADTLDYDQMFLASRYEKGDAAYWNAPLNAEQYDELREALLGAEKAEAHNAEDVPFFESCLPIEELAARGRLTMRYGPLRGAGLTDPKTGRWPFACVQLRAENEPATMFNLVGFQTRLKWPEQTRMLRLIPGLQNVEILRYGVIHKNIFINSPAVLLPTLQTKARAELFFAGQLTGVEGYVESAAMGLIAGLNAARLLMDSEPVVFPATTILGALTTYVTGADPKHFQPMNCNWGLLPPPVEKIAKADKPAFLAERAGVALESLIMERGLEI